MKISFKIIILLIFIWPFNLQKLQAQEEIKIGLLVPLSGKQSDIGKSIMQSVKLAIIKLITQILKYYLKIQKMIQLKLLRLQKNLNLKELK